MIEDACHALEQTIKLKTSIIKLDHVNMLIFQHFLYILLNQLQQVKAALSLLIKEIYKKIISYRSHGIKRNKINIGSRYSQLSYNFRLSDINCSLGLSQLKN